MAEGEKRGAIGRAKRDPYSEEAKYPEPTVCPRCGLVYRAGRWQAAREAPPDRAKESHCPACRRAIDRYPAGLVNLEGSYFEEKRDEILNIVRNQEAAVCATRPLQRILWIEEKKGAVEIATTNSHLALRIGKAVHSACKGDLVVKRAGEDPLVRVFWTREN